MNKLRNLKKPVSNLLSSKTSLSEKLADQVDYFEQYSKHRTILPLFDFVPAVSAFASVAPSATLVGEVTLCDQCSIGHNVVLRGDINSVRIGQQTHIGDNTVVHTANSLPTGIPAVFEIGMNSIVQANCSLYSCIIKDNVFIGAGSTIMEGCIIEEGAVIAPNSVVPPGRLIPAGQLWGGNPVKFIRKLKQSEIFNNYVQSYLHVYTGEQLANSFEDWDDAYLFRESTDEDLNPTAAEISSGTFVYGRDIKSLDKHYIL